MSIRFHAQDGQFTGFYIYGAIMAGAPSIFIILVAPAIDMAAIVDRMFPVLSYFGFDCHIRNPNLLQIFIIARQCLHTFLSVSENIFSVLVWFRCILLNFVILCMDWTAKLLGSSILCSEATGHITNSIQD